VTPYTGNAGNVSLGSAVSISIPQDGVDSLAVSTVNTPMQKEADYLEALHQNYSGAIVTFVANPGNAANTGYWAWIAGSQAAVALNPTTDQGVGQNRILIPFSGSLRGFKFKTGQTTAGNPVTVQVNNITQSTLSQFVVSTGTVAGTLGGNSGGALFGVAAGDLVSVQINNAVGVTASIGLTPISLYFGAF
jgi:hypothetical protein